LTEIGPKMEMRLFRIVLGTLEQGDADVEFALRSFIRSKAPLLRDRTEQSYDEM
jgi:U3 small nucleolar ribonucleoprotein protein IMP4